METLHHDFGAQCICVGHKGEYVRDPACPKCNEEDEAQEPIMPSACPSCGCEAAHSLGTLGRRAHFRCVGCGNDYSERLA